MIRNIGIGLISIVVGFVFGIYCIHPLPNKFMEVRLFEIIQLVATLLFGGFIAYFFSQKLNSWGKRSEIVYNHLSEMLTKYQKNFDRIEQFIQDTISIPTKEITLFFKELSSNIATLEKHSKNLKIDPKTISSIRTSHEKMNELIVKDTWGVDPSKIKYTDDDKSNIKKEFSIITGFIEDLRIKLYK